jgi:hypothetical protein
MVNKSPLVLPLVEKKIEQVLKSASPRECFTDETVDPNRFVVVASWGMANTGSEQALVEVAKLIKLDEKRFGQLRRRKAISFTTEVSCGDGSCSSIRREICWASD